MSRKLNWRAILGHSLTVAILVSGLLHITKTTIMFGALLSVSPERLADKNLFWERLPDFGGHFSRTTALLGFSTLGIIFSVSILWWIARLGSKWFLVRPSISMVLAFMAGIGLCLAWSQKQPKIEIIDQKVEQLGNDPARVSFEIEASFSESNARSYIKYIQSDAGDFDLQLEKHKRWVRDEAVLYTYWFGDDEPTRLGLLAALVIFAGVYTPVWLRSIDQRAQKNEPDPVESPVEP